MRVFLVLLVVFYSSSITYSQSLKRFIQNTVKNNSIIIPYGDSVAYISVIDLEKLKNIKPDESNRYYWYTNGQIKSSRGAYSGRLLDGDYLLFSRNKDLVEKGKFKKGLKVGDWKRWYINGEINQISAFKNGERNGLTKFYNVDGIKISQINFKNNLPHGISLTLKNNGKVEKKKFKYGKEVIRKVKFNTPVDSLRKGDARKDKKNLFFKGKTRVKAK